MSEVDDTPKKDPQSDAENDGDDDGAHGKQATRQNIKVICRIRPTNHKELSHGGVTVLTHTEKAIEVKMDDHEPLHFNFDRVFGDETAQADLFEKSSKPLIRDIFAGYNATIFAYGQTGTGKTFTMEGDINSEENKGIIPRAIEEIFHRIDDADDAIEFTIKVAYIEIYMEKIRDLLDNTRQKVNLQVRENTKTGIYIEDVTEEYVTSVKGVLKLMQSGAKNRSVAATGMNEGSSRSHSVFTLTLSQKHLHTQEVTTGKLVLVDLAGSEMVKKTNSSGQQLEEAKTINKSLSALGMVINALTDEKSTHVPYRDSKLTRLLQDSLGGNSKTVLIIAISPSSFNAPESVSTMRFGTRAKSIENKVAVNTVRTVETLEALLEKAELAIDKQSSFIMALKAQLDCVLAQQQAGEQGAAMNAAENAAAMAALRDMIEKTNTELAEERAYSSKITKKLQEVTDISDGRKALIEDATTMLEALQADKTALAERVAVLLREKAELAAGFEEYKTASHDEISKLTFLTAEQEGSLETLRAENALLSTDNAALREKVLTTIISPKRKQSLYSLRDSESLSMYTPSKDAADIPAPPANSTTATQSLGIAGMDEESVPAETEAAPSQPAAAAETTEVLATPVKAYEAMDRSFDHICQQIATETLEGAEEDKATIMHKALKSMEQYALDDLIPMLPGSVDFKDDHISEEDHYVVLRDALRDKFDEIMHNQHELTRKQDVLHIEKLELQKKVDQRDERIKSLEEQQKEQVNHLMERTKQFSQEVQELNEQILKLKTDHQHAIEELKKQHEQKQLEQARNPVSPITGEFVRSPKSLRGGGGSRYHLFKEEEEERRQQSNAEHHLKVDDIDLDIRKEEVKEVEKKKVNFEEVAVTAHSAPAPAPATPAASLTPAAAPEPTPAAPTPIAAAVKPTPAAVSAPSSNNAVPPPAGGSPPPAACCIIS